VSDDFFYDKIQSTSFRGDPPIVWEGEIVALEKKQATTYDADNPGTGEPRFWPDGNPMMQGWITLQTDVRDDDDDDGRRVMVLDSKNKRTAVQNAVKASGQKIELGGRLKVEYYGRDPKGKNPDNLPKLYRAWYTPPTEGAPAPPTTQSPPGIAASAPTATASTQGPNPDDLIKLAKAGIPVAGMDAAQIAILAATL
jgi:hypothetical protein